MLQKAAESKGCELGLLEPSLGVEGQPWWRTLIHANVDAAVAGK